MVGALPLAHTHMQTLLHLCISTIRFKITDVQTELTLRTRPKGQQKCFAIFIRSCLRNTDERKPPHACPRGKGGSGSLSDIPNAPLYSREVSPGTDPCSNCCTFLALMQEAELHCTSGADFRLL